MVSRRVVDPKQQFSKWLARYGAIIWGLYAFAVLGLIAYRPEAAMACVWLTLIMTCNKALDTVSYTKNSTTEKIILGMLDKTSMELSLKTGSSDKDKKEKHSSDDSEEEGGGNG